MRLSLDDDGLSRRGAGTNLRLGLAYKSRTSNLNVGLKSSFLYRAVEAD